MDKTLGEMIEELGMEEAVKQLSEMACEMFQEGAKDQFFSSKNASLNYDIWTKKAYLTPEEMAAILLFVDPKVVHKESMMNAGDLYNFPLQYLDLVDDIERAQKIKDLPDNITPQQAILWAYDTALYPEDDLEMVEAMKELFHVKDEHIESYSFKTKKASSLIGKGKSIIKNQYWNSLQKKASRAIKLFPEWSQTQNVVQKTGNLQDWLVNTIGLDNREAEVIKKVLSEEYKDII